MKHRVQKKIKLCLAVLAFGVILGTGIYYNITIGNAASVTTGTVNTNGGSLNVRSGPGTGYAALGAVSKGAQVTIVGEEGDWYKIRYNATEGYVRKDYIINIQTAEVDDAYADSLAAQGFPQSYVTALSSLHSKYPSWVFEPVNTGLDWSTVLKEEAKLGRNLVQAINNDAQKSTEAGAYNWATNQWIGYDGSGWVCASESMIAYCMDPRNFLNEEGIFQFATSEYQNYQNAGGVKALVNGSFLAGEYIDTNGKKKSYPDTFVTAGSKVGVSPYHLAARCLQEQGSKGTSGSISGTVSGYENYFNYFNIGAYPANGLNSVQNGLRYAREKGWNSREAAILGGAEIVGNNYVQKGQNTVYFEKFNVVNKTSGLYSHQYMTNIQAAASEGKNTKKAYTDVNAAIVFRIPIYSNMPESACAIPNSGNPNNWIKSLTIKGYGTTPKFNSSKTEYSLIVESNVDSVEISGVPVASGSTISGMGTIKLNYGTNQVKINCTAQNQTVRTYTLNIVRNAAEGNAGSKGDVNGDGEISLSDLVAVKRHILDFEKLSGTQFELADVDGDASIGLTDYVKIKRHILGYEKLK